MSIDFGDIGPVCPACGRERGHSGPCYIVGEAHFTSREETALVDSMDLLSRPMTRAKVTAINENLFSQVLRAHMPQLQVDAWHQPVIDGCGCGWTTPATSSMRYGSWVEHIIKMARVTPLVIS